MSVIHIPTASVKPAGEFKCIYPIRESYMYFYNMNALNLTGYIEKFIYVLRKQNCSQLLMTDDTYNIIHRTILSYT